MQRVTAHQLQANIPETEGAEEWRLDDLAKKVGQYCFLLENMGGNDLKEASGGDFDKLRAFLHEQGEAAYREKVRDTDSYRNRSDYTFYICASFERWFGCVLPAYDQAVR